MNNNKKKTTTNYSYLSRKNTNIPTILRKVAETKRKLKNLITTKEEELRKTRPTTKKYENYAEQLATFKNLYNTLN